MLALLAAGGALDARSADQRTALHRATGNGIEEILEALLAGSCWGSASGCSGGGQRRGRHYSAATGCMCRPCRCDPGASCRRHRRGFPRVGRDEGGKTGLQWAARHGKKKTMVALLRAGAKLDARDGLLATSLQVATVEDHDVITLRRCGRCSLPARLWMPAMSTGIRRCTLLRIMATSRRCGSCLAVLAAGAAADARNALGMTPLGCN